MKYEVGDLVRLSNVYSCEDVQPNKWIVTHAFNTGIGVRYTVEHVGSNNLVISGVSERHLLGDSHESN